jgi:arabinose-5-phosphate isomerase
MHSGQNLPKVLPSASLMEVIKSLTTPALGAVIVAGDAGEMLGIITDGDLRRTLERHSDEFQTLTAEQMMTHNPISTAPEMLAFDALEVMENRPSQISVLPVVDAAGKAVGLLRLHDVVRGYL